MSTQAAAPALTPAALPVAAHLPKIGTPFNGGIYAGIIRGVGDQPDAHLVLLEGAAINVTWTGAIAFAEGAGGYLPTRREQALLFANLPEHFERDWYWSGEQHAAYEAYAWSQYFDDGHQFINRKSAGGRARAVRRFTI